MAVVRSITCSSLHIYPKLLKSAGGSGCKRRIRHPVRGNKGIWICYAGLYPGRLHQVHDHGPTCFTISFESLFGKPLAGGHPLQVVIIHSKPFLPAVIEKWRSVTGWKQRCMDKALWKHQYLFVWRWRSYPTLC